jgi:hypothetical protein
MLVHMPGITKCRWRWKKEPKEQKSGGLVAFRSDPFPLGMGCSLRTARSGQGRAVVARRSEPSRARTVLRSSCKRERCGPEWTAKMAQSLAASNITKGQLGPSLGVPAGLGVAAAGE